MSDHYRTLGVVPTADPAIIKAAYRALVAIYHPDKNKSSEAPEKIKEINIAYETLSDPGRRKQYDSSAETAGSAKASEFENTPHFKDDQIEKAWDIASKFHPSIASDFMMLEKISWRLAFSFKLNILENQAFDKSSEIATTHKYKYLSRFFGKDPANIKFAEDLIRSREISAAIFLNEIIDVMGRSASPWQIQQQVFSQFKNTEKNLKKRQIYAVIKGFYGSPDHNQAELLINMHGGTVTRSGIFRKKIYLQLNGEQKTFDSNLEFAKYVEKLYEEEYA
jgi:curved DNA-binding protein CbpA